MRIEHRILLTNILVPILGSVGAQLADNRISHNATLIHGKT